MSLKQKLRKMAFVKDKVQRAAKHDKVNIADKIRQPDLKTYLKNAVVNPLIKLVKGETSTVNKVDLDMNASREEQNLLLVAKRNGQNSNLISYEVKDVGETSVEVVNQHIIIKIEDGVTDFDAVVAAIEANPHASRLVSVALTGAGTDLVVQAPSKTLNGGR
jgi:hypothetical protein